MTDEEANIKLFEKLTEEQERYREWIKALPIDDVLRNSYEYNIREDMLIHLEYNDLSGKQAKALLKSPKTMRDLYRAWEQRETDHMNVIGDTIECHANEIIRNDFLKAKRKEEER